MALSPQYLDDEEGVVVETREAYPSHFLFKFESFSLLSDAGIDKYETTDFVAGEYKWRLIIYPDGRDSGNKGDHVSVYLAMANTSSLPATWEVNAVFSIFLLNQKLDNFLSVRGRARRFHALHPEWGFSKFISKKSLTDPSNGYLVGDKCVFGAEVFVIKSQGTIECLSILNAEVPYKHSFNISNFSKLEDVWISDNFILGDQTWSRKVYPRGNGEGKGRDVSIFLYLVDSKPSSYRKLKVKYTIGIKNQYTDENHILSGEDVSSHIRRRGPNHGTQVPANSDSQTKINVIDSKFIEGFVTRNIINDLKSIYTEPYPSWQKIPSATQELLWDNFKMRYRWDNLSDVGMRKVWNETAVARFKDLLYKAKKKAKDDAKKELGREPSTLELIGRGPKWMDKSVWNELVQNHWATEDYEEKCEKARQNRMNENAGKHTCGSIPREVHRQKMENELKRPVDDFELFEHTHKRKSTGDFVDVKSKKISEEYRAKRNCTDSSPLEFDLPLWSDLIGGSSKGRMYGVARSHISSGYSQSTVNSRVRGESHDELTKVVDDVRATAMKIEEDARKREEEREKRLEQVLEQVQKREEEAQKKSEAADKKMQEVEEMLQKMLQQVGLPNHKYASGSGHGK